MNKIMGAIDLSSFVGSVGGFGEGGCQGVNEMDGIDRNESKGVYTTRIYTAAKFTKSL